MRPRIIRAGGFTGFTAAAWVVLALLAAPAPAKTGLVLNPLPYDLYAGQPWNVTIRYIRADRFVSAPRGSHPFMRIVSLDSNAQLDFPVRGTATGGLTARVLFPRAGLWRFTVHGLGSAVDKQTWDPVTIAAKPKPISAAVSHDPSSFPYGWVIAGVILALGGMLAIRLRR
jgi:hypothetical protein